MDMEAGQIEFVATARAIRTDHADAILRDIEVATPFFATFRPMLDRRLPFPFKEEEVGKGEVVVVLTTAGSKNRCPFASESPLKMV